MKFIHLFVVVVLMFCVPAFSTDAQTDLNLSKTVESLQKLKQLPLSEPSLQRLYLVRHGESTANVYFEVNGKKVRYVSGQSLNIPLTEVGREQIQQLAKKLAERFPKDMRLVITSSTALRTQQTAKILFDELSKTHPHIILTTEVYAGLSERSLGKWEGELRDEKYTQATLAWKALPAAKKFFLPEVEGGESYRDVVERALPALEEIYDRYSGSTIIAVTSYHAINATAIQMNNLIPSLSTVPESNLPNLDLDNGDLVLLEIPSCFKNIEVVSHIKND